MKIAAIYFDDMVVVPGGRDLGGGLAQGDERASSFVATEGWDIRETLPGVFSLLREGMAEPVTIGGYGYSYVKAAEGPAVSVSYERGPGYNENLDGLTSRPKKKR